jgi:hypothetical protein
MLHLDMNNRTNRHYHDTQRPILLRMEEADAA